MRHQSHDVTRTKVLPGLFAPYRLYGMCEACAIQYLEEHGWIPKSCWQDYRALFHHPSGYWLKLVVEMQEEPVCHGDSEDPEFLMVTGFDGWGVLPCN